VTYHLTPRVVWESQSAGPYFRPEAYEQDGFIHCTDGEEQVVRVANAFYVGDSREHVVLVIDITRIRAEVKYEDPDRIFPHIYGPLNVDAVAEVRSIERGPTGRYLRFGT
jgi:uncharacterized protein (DUF952 family)